MRPELTQNLWERYGFRDNPFDTRALSMTPDSILSVSQAFVGRGERSQEATVMTNFLRSPGGGRIIVEGEIGVGKTTFVNYHRYLWENEAQTRLITPASEISVHQGWGAREFLLSILGSLAGRLALTMKRGEAEKDPFLTEIFALTSVLIKETKEIGGGISILGSGGNISRTRSLTVQLGEISTTKLQDYLETLLKRIRRRRFSGAILHLNNLELLARQNVSDLRRFFDEIRDYLQVPDLYFVFVGNIGMFQEAIVPLERVRSIFFGQPIHLPPLTCEEVHHAINRRYELMAIKKGRWISPVDDQLIDYLYEIFSGKIRFIMDAITTLVIHLPEGVTGTMSSKFAQNFLKELTQQRIRAILTQVEENILLSAVKLKRFTNSSLVKATGKSKQNVAKYMRRFLKLNFVYQAGRKGRNVYYKIAPDLLLLGFQTKR